MAALLPVDDSALLQAEGMIAQGAMKLRVERPGQSAQIIEVQEHGLR